MAIYITRAPAETCALGRRLGRVLPSGSLVAFRGGMGAGKTTMCRGIAEGLGCVDPVASPSFAIVNLYRGPRPFAHFDLYRVEDAQDLEAAGFYDYLDTGAVVALEWSERLEKLPLPPDVTVTIRVLPDEAREIEIEGGNPL